MAVQQRNRSEPFDDRTAINWTFDHRKARHIFRCKNKDFTRSKT